MDTLEAYVDDIGCTVFDQRGLVADRAVAMCASIIQALQRIGLTVNRSRTAVICDHRGIAIKVARALGADTRPEHMFTGRHVGCDNAPLRPRRWISTGSMLTMRVKKVAGLMQRLQRLRRVVGMRATAVFRTGVLPAMTYGSPVCGASPTELVRMEDVAANGLWPRSRGRLNCFTTGNH